MGISLNNLNTILFNKQLFNKLFNFCNKNFLVCIIENNIKVLLIINIE